MMMFCGKRPSNRIYYLEYLASTFARKKMGRQKWNKEKMERLITDFESSGMTVKEFCIQEGLSKSTFEYWRRKLKRNQAAKSSGFQQILPVRQLPSEQIRLLGPNGITIELPVGYPSKDLLKIIRSISC